MSISRSSIIGRMTSKEVTDSDSVDQVCELPLLQEGSSRESTIEYTGDGSISIFGHLASKNHTGNWKASSLSLVCLFCSYLAFSSLTKNLVSYLTKVLHETNVVAARNVSAWHGTSYLAPLIGAFIADSYLGNYWTSLIFCTIFITGMVMLIVSTAVPLISNHSLVWLTWTDTVSFQYIIVFIGLYMVALGYGAQNPCITSFGADQFDHTDEEERNKKSSFFNWRYFIINAASLISGTIVVWVQDHEGWLWGFIIASIFVALGAVIFVLGSTLYRFQRIGGSPMARLCQVIVAATCNFNKDLPCDSSLLYEVPEQHSSTERSRKLEHTTGLEKPALKKVSNRLMPYFSEQYASFARRFFDKAAIVIQSDSESVAVLNTWRICTVTQVEELKILIRLLPIWATMMLFSTVLEQMYSTFVEQGTVMDKRIGSFEIPAASFQCVDVIAVLVLVPVYDRILVPVFRRFTGMPYGITPLQRMGVSLFLSMLSMVSAALVESNRLQIAHHASEVAAPMSILWQGPQYFLIGVGEVFSIGLQEFFYEESPDAMRSMCLAFSFANDSAGYYLSSFIVSLVPVFTARGGSPGWIPDNLNEGHLDRYYWMMAGLSFLNLLAFIFCAMRYKSKKLS